MQCVFKMNFAKMQCIFNYICQSLTLFSVGIAEPQSTIKEFPLLEKHLFCLVLVIWKYCSSNLICCLVWKRIKLTEITCLKN